MVDLDWHDFYEIGIDFIDSEHKHILEIMRGIRDAILVDNYNECSTLSKVLITEAENHFKHEEEFLKQHQYPDLSEHIQYHKGLLIQANKIREICEGTEKNHDLIGCFEAMEKFLVDDIFEGDIVFKSFLEFKGIIPRKL